jgi:Tol biopolymer transport system component
MTNSSKWFSTLLISLVTLLVSVGCKPAGNLLLDPQSGKLVSPIQTPSAFVSALPTPKPTIIDLDIEPTLGPSPTPPPVPTQLPTPVVTPIPVAKPPFIPEVVGKVQQPFWIYYWQGNEIWRIDDSGKDQQLLLDTYKSLGLYLTANPQLETLVNAYQESRVVPSPDGKTLALVVVDKPGLVHKDETATFSIYLFSVDTGDLKLLSEGASPTWSPDGGHIAFVRGITPDGSLSDGGLWIADLETNKIYPLVKGEPTNPLLHVSYWMWSPSSKQITYRYSDGLIDKPEILIKSVDDSSVSYLVPNLPADTYLGCSSWMPDEQYLLCYVKNKTLPEHPIEFWTVSIKTGERKLLAKDLFISFPGQWSLDGKWLVLSAVHLYEHKEEPYNYDLWLLSADGTSFVRLTSTPPDNGQVQWSPDGTRLVFRREGVGLVTLSLETDKVIPLGVDLQNESSYNYAIGGIK